MALFSEVVSEIAADAPGAPLMLLESALVGAYRRVCKDTMVWETELSPITLVAGTPTYSLLPAAGEDIATIMAAYVNDKRLSSISMDAAVRRFVPWPMVRTTASDIASYGGYPIAFREVSPKSVMLFPAPDAAEVYTMRVVVAAMPPLGAASIPDEVHERASAAANHMALQKVMAMKDVAWSSKDRAVYHAKQGTYHMALLRANSSLGGSVSSMAVAGRPWL